MRQPCSHYKAIPCYCWSIELSRAAPVIDQRKISARAPTQTANEVPIAKDAKMKNTRLAPCVPGILDMIADTPMVAISTKIAQTQDVTYRYRPTLNVVI